MSSPAVPRELPLRREEICQASATEDVADVITETSAALAVR